MIRRAVKYSSRLHVVSNKLFIINDYEFHDTAEEVIEILIMPL